MEVKKLRGGGGRVACGQLAHDSQVSIEGRPYCATNEVADEFRAGVVDAAALTSPFVGEPKQITSRDVKGLASRGCDVAVGLGVICVVAVGHREAQRQQAFVDVAQVPDLQPGEVDPRLRIVSVTGQRD